VHSVTPAIAQPPVPVATSATAPAPTSTTPVAPTSTAPAAAPASASESASGATTATAPSPLDAALECLSRGDNLCVISRLEGRAKTARELEVLIETHLALGNAVDAERSMRRYLERFPDGKGAAKYQRWLERRAEPRVAP
jgi:hypothetical protein